MLYVKKVGVLQVALVTLGRHIGLLNNWYCQPEETEVSEASSLSLASKFKLSIFFRSPPTPSFFLCQHT